MHPREVVAATLLVLLAACAQEAPPRLTEPTARFAAPVALPPPDTRGGTSLDRAISERRSARAFAGRPLSRALIGQLLWAAQGVTSADRKRSAPSAGGLYPLELYVVSRGVVLHYLPEGHRVEARHDVDLRRRLRRAALGQSVVGDAPAVIVVAAAPARTRAKYGALAERFVALEAGHATQNILREAAARDLAAVPVGGLDPEAVRRVLALPPGDDVLYLVPIGHRT